MCVREVCVCEACVREVCEVCERCVVCERGVCEVCERSVCEVWCVQLKAGVTALQEHQPLLLALSSACRQMAQFILLSKCTECCCHAPSVEVATSPDPVSLQRHCV